MESNSRLSEYAEIIKNEDCLKILYYLYKYNPDVPLRDINEKLGIPVGIASVCIEKLTRAGVIFKNIEKDGYTMTPFGRSAFRELINAV